MVLIWNHKVRNDGIETTSNQNVCKRLLMFAQSLSLATECRCHIGTSSCPFFKLLFLQRNRILDALKKVVSDGEPVAKPWAFRAALVIVDKLALASQKVLCAGHHGPAGEDLLPKPQTRAIYYVRECFDSVEIPYEVIQVMFEHLTDHMREPLYLISKKATRETVSGIHRDHIRSKSRLEPRSFDMFLGAHPIVRPCLLSEIFVVMGHLNERACKSAIDVFILLFDNPNNCDIIQDYLPNWPAFILRLVQKKTDFGDSSTRQKKKSSPAQNCALKQTIFRRLVRFYQGLS